jgi:hypothetical protein
MAFSILPRSVKCCADFFGGHMVQDDVLPQQSQLSIVEGNLKTGGAGRVNVVATGDHTLA